MNNFSQEMLAKKIKVHPNLLSPYDHDLAASSMEVVPYFADKFDVCIDQYFYSRQQNAEGVISDKELLMLFKNLQLLSPRYKETLKNLISAFVLKANCKEKIVKLAS